MLVLIFSGRSHINTLLQIAFLWCVVLSKCLIIDINISMKVISHLTRNIFKACVEVTIIIPLSLLPWTSFFHPSLIGSLLWGVTFMWWHSLKRCQWHHLLWQPVCLFITSRWILPIMSLVPVHLSPGAGLNSLHFWCATVVLGVERVLGTERHTWDAPTYSGKTSDLVWPCQVNRPVSRPVFWLVPWLGLSRPTGPGTPMVRELPSGPTVVTCVYSSTTPSKVR